MNLFRKTKQVKQLRGEVERLTKALQHLDRAWEDLSKTRDGDFCPRVQCQGSAKRLKQAERVERARVLGLAALAAERIPRNESDNYRGGYLDGITTYRGMIEHDER